MPGGKGETEFGMLAWAATFYWRDSFAPDCFSTFVKFRAGTLGLVLALLFDPIVSSMASLYGWLGLTPTELSRWAWAEF